MDNATPPTGPTGQPPIKGPQGPNPDDMAAGGKNPFAEMFERTGHPLTQKQLKAIVNQFIKDIIARIKKDDEQWKKAMDHMKKVIEGKE